MPQKPITKIGVDFDDVLFDFNAQYVDHHNRLYGTDMTRDRINNYMMEKVWNMPIEEIFPRIEKFYNSDDHDASAPVFGAKEALEKMSQKYHVTVVTSRPDSMKERTMHWLERHFGGLIHDIHFTNQFMGTGKKRSKSEVCNELGINLFIEDAPIYSLNIAKAGIPVLLLDTPWNQGVEHELITRVYSWKEIVDHVM